MWPRDSEREFWAATCRDSFWHFFLYAWGAKFNPDGKFIDPAVHKRLCDWLQDLALPWLAARGTPNAYQLLLAILFPRRGGKSVIVTRAFNAWLHLHDPNLATAIGSMKEEFAVEHTEPIKMVYEGQDPFAWFSWLYGNWYNPKRTWKARRFTHAARTSHGKADASFAAFGVDSGLTSKHPDVIDLDDPTSYEKMKQDIDWLPKVNDLVESLAYVLEADGMFILPGTRYADGDHFGTYFRADGIKSVAGMPNDTLQPTEGGAWDVFHWDVCDGEDHETAPLTLPTVWSRAAIKRQFTRKPRTAASQLRNNPNMSPDNPLREDDLQWIDEKELPPFRQLQITFHCDTALLDEKGHRSTANAKNWSVFAVMGHYPDGTGRVVFLDSFGSPTLTASQYIQNMIDMVVKWRRNGCIDRGMTDDRILGGHKGGWRLALEGQFNARGVRMPQLFEVTRPGSVKKDARIRAVTPFWKDGRVLLLRTAPGVDHLAYQMTHIGTSEQNDYADAVSDVFYEGLYQQITRLTEPTREEPIELPMDRYLKGHGYEEDADSFITRLREVR